MGHKGLIYEISRVRCEPFPRPIVSKHNELLQLPSPEQNGNPAPLWMRSLRIYIARAPLLNTEFGGNCTIRDFEVTAGLWPANGGDRNIGNSADRRGWEGGEGGRRGARLLRIRNSIYTRPLRGHSFSPLYSLSLSLSDFRPRVFVIQVFLDGNGHWWNV